MAVQRIALDLLRFPKLYIRGRVKGDYVLNMQQVARDAMKTDGTKLDASKWPFPPIKVRAVEQEVKEAKKPKDGEAPVAPAKPVILYEIIDGINRTRCAQHLKLDDIPAVVVTADDKHAALMQLGENVKNGLYLDRDSRNGWIKMLVKELKVTTREVAKETGLSHASVSRIANARQATGETGKRAEAAKKRKRGGKRRGGAAVTWSPKMFVRQLESLVKEFDEHQAEITEALEKSERDVRISQGFQTWIDKLAPVR